MVTFLFTALFSISMQVQASDVGFSSTNDFVATPIEGRVDVTCEGFNGSGFAKYRCRDIVLEPQSYDYFVGPKEPNARKVELRAYHADGSDRSKMSLYDGTNGRSRDSFNLWISTLFQKPLLEVGVNRVTYSLYSDDKSDLKEYTRGEFTAVVTKGTPRLCPATSYNSTDINDCNAQYSVCQRYFEQYNYCR
ncbi:hypothetical protein D3C87_88610 [compost metagenome]